jgi:hypothetical protein
VKTSFKVPPGSKAFEKSEEILNWSKFNINEMES